MLRSTLVTVALSAAIAFPAHAGTSMPACDDPSMRELEGKIGSMADSASKETAAGELMMAKRAVRIDRPNECSMHLENVLKAMNASM